jgi:hydroxylamine dehydrogenase
MSEDTKIREMAALKDRVAKLEVKRVSLLDPDNSSTRVSLGGLGGALLLAGGVALVGWRRREKSDR